MGDYPERETPEQKMATLRKMVADKTFRLSLNEQSAITYALRRMANLERKLAEATKATD